MTTDPKEKALAQIFWHLYYYQLRDICSSLTPFKMKKDLKVIFVPFYVSEERLYERKVTFDCETFQSRPLDSIPVLNKTVDKVKEICNRIASSLNVRVVFEGPIFMVEREKQPVLVIRVEGK